MELTIRKGTVADTEQFIRLLDTVREAMEHKEWFYLDPHGFVREMMKTGKMELWVAMDGERMAAAFDILRPGLDEYNYGYDLNLTKEQLLRVINMDSAAVLPEYRGLGLQRKLIAMGEEQLRREGKRILLCTVHPDNRFSLDNVLKQGYQIQKKLDKYGSVRYLLRKDLGSI